MNAESLKKLEDILDEFIRKFNRLHHRVTVIEGRLETLEKAAEGKAEARGQEESGFREPVKLRPSHRGT